jgi:hypothetical protein
MADIAKVELKVRDRQAERAAVRESVVNKVPRVGLAAVEARVVNKVLRVEVAVAEALAANKVLQVAAGKSKVHDRTFCGRLSLRERRPPPPT